ncbi:hypothetical protein PRBRB14_20850 [Hallella multisaccharivorax DSM 17128]|uniref:DUF308 domain-containing protein n=1 Tax=Hallella multisaccharivorax DSM 17128 TaxID=688246 RepID=F8N7Z3_9BACT|nr:DUF308 domain-containing protein [Hallella multisaccharivorax]EGN57539.1 hypothetical protein Premu_2149 [Hallella multisaccharivorax DSM 17128]GJG31206.1 hypothetical protein PRBRB14_20850 [Hallella multisaccharivorax DSM 17128]
MKPFRSSIFRAVCAIAIGALLVKYREQTVTWITVVVGAIFLVSGIISITSWFASKRRNTDSSMDIYDAQGRLINVPAPPFPIVGLGSIILGGVLALFPNSFVNGLMYVLAAMLILGALTQFFNLTVARRFANIGIVWWVFPTLVLLVGLVAVLKPSFIATAPLLVLGWCMMVYGVVDLINSIKIHQCRKQMSQPHGTQDAVAEEVTEAKPEEPAS